MHTFTLVANAGRSGSTYLAALLRENYGHRIHVAHEEMHASVSQPRRYNRAYSSESIDKVLSDTKLLPYLERWLDILREKPVIETGWTAYHLLPVLNHITQGNLRFIILHRNPVVFAMSRATMGNYHPNTFYDQSHEVSPFDEGSIAPQKAGLWDEMNHFEKCLFWWYVVYREAYEFRERFPAVPCIEVCAERELFDDNYVGKIFDFLDLPVEEFEHTEVARNPMGTRLKEIFPIKDHWQSFRRHDDILAFGARLGHEFDWKDLEKQARKYSLPDTIGAKIRHHTRFWFFRKRIVDIVKYRQINRRL